MYGFDLFVYYISPFSVYMYVEFSVAVVFFPNTKKGQNAILFLYKWLLYQFDPFWLVCLCILLSPGVIKVDYFVILQLTRNIIVCLSKYIFVVSLPYSVLYKIYNCAHNFEYLCISFMIFMIFFFSHVIKFFFVFINLFFIEEYPCN